MLATLRYPLVGVGIFLGILVVTFNVGSWSLISLHPYSTSSPTNIKYCTRSDIDNGWWENGTLIKEYDEIPAAYGYQTWKNNFCGVKGAEWHDQNTTGGSIEDERQRKLQVAIPVFIKGGNCRYRSAETRAKLIMLLRMPAGAYLIGDSIALQTMRAHENLWEGWGPVIGSQEGDWDWYPLSRSLSLDPDHPDTLDLLEEAGASKERLDYPLMKWYRTWHILWREHLDAAFFGISGYELADGVFKYDIMDWYPQVNWAITEARNRVKFAVGTLEEPTVILMHAGPHFIPAELGVEINDEGLIRGWRSSVDYVERLMRDLPFPVNLYWQTTIPGHQDCMSADTFDNNRTTWKSTRNTGAPLMYNYHLFPLFNDHLRERFSADTPRRRNHQTSDRNPTFRLLDTWSLSLKRPDAHRGPPSDYLHYCSTSVPDEWVKYWWHLMLEESANEMSIRAT